MRYHGASQRGGVLRILIIVLALVAVTAVAVWLIYTRGGKMQDELHKKGDELRDKVSFGGVPEPGQDAEGSARSPDATTGSELPKPKGPYTVEKPPPVAKALHRVSKGETFFRIAETYYENGTLWPLIAEANGLKTPADLKEGMIIIIPGK